MGRLNQFRNMSGQVEVPYWKDYTTNAVRGIIAAVCCAAFFAILGLLHKFRWQPPTEDEMTASYKRKQGCRSFLKCGGALGNLGVHIPPKIVDFWVLLHFYVTMFSKLGVHRHPRNQGCGTPERKSSEVTLEKKGQDNKALDPE